jgi:septal ring factor EnvC (AmiA/AmiB activator)
LKLSLQQLRRAPLAARLLSSLLLVASFSCAQAASTPRNAQKKQLESERAELQQKLKALKTDINKTETAKDKANDALEDSEQAISEANRSLRDLQSEQAQTTEKLQQLKQQQAQLSLKVEKQKTQLSEFLRRQYMRGDSDRIKLLLSGDNPNRINRDLQYMGYVSQTQAKMIASLKMGLLEIEKNTLQAQEAKDDLDEIAKEERENKVLLENEKKRRAHLLTQLADKLHAQKKEADNLQKNEQRLSSLVSRLNQIMEEQAKAELARAAQAEKLRQEKQAAEKIRKEREKLAAQQAKPGSKAGKITYPNPIDADEAPAKVATRIEATPIASSNDGTAFKNLKGSLRLPVKGELIAKFGSKRGDGPSWKGLFIKAVEGAEVKAIAAGKVVFAEWLRGFGNMIIVDHGGQYLSLYSNNQAVLKHAGDSVKSGDVIASAGNSGGNEESGLYFELRHQGRVFDPLTWTGKNP